MGPAFVILFWMVLLGIFALVWGGSLFIFLLSCLQNRRWLKILGVIPVGLLTVAFILLVGTLAYGVVQSTRPTVVFEQVFGTEPPPGVTQLRSRYWFFADSGSIHLGFQCAPNLFDEIRPPHLVRTSPEIIEDAIVGWEQDRPGWSYPTDRVKLQFYSSGLTGHEGGKHFSSETELLAYDPESGTAFYHYSGID